MFKWNTPQELFDGLVKYTLPALEYHCTHHDRGFDMLWHGETQCIGCPFGPDDSTPDPCEHILRNELHDLMMKYTDERSKQLVEQLERCYDSSMTDEDLCLECPYHDACENAYLHPVFMDVYQHLKSKGVSFDAP